MAKININEVEYLAFEGGGGKGIAYLGAMAAFTDDKIGIFKKPLSQDYLASDEIVIGQDTDEYYLDINKIKGVSGSSAGAITAALIGCQVPVRKLYEKLLDLDLMTKENIFDAPPFTEREIISPSKKNYIDYEKRPWGIQLAATAVRIYTLSETIIDLILKGDDLGGNYGLISGKFLMTQFDKLIADNFPQVERNGQKEAASFLTFKEHYEAMDNKFELILTGTRLEDGHSQYFSHVTTPNLPIIIAARISMGFPGVFKPVVFDDENMRKLIGFSDAEKKILKGTWVDRGLINNLPIHAFRDFKPDESTFEKQKNVLGIRLGISSRKVIDGPFKHFGAVVEILSSNITELNIDNQEERDRILLLPISSGLNSGYQTIRTFFGTKVASIPLKPYELGTLDFEINPKAVFKILPEVVKSTFSYFNLSIPNNNAAVLLSRFIPKTFVKEALKP